MKIIVYKGPRAVQRFDGSTPDSFYPYTCGYCEHNVSGAVIGMKADIDMIVRWLECPVCGNPSVLDAESKTHPVRKYGKDIKGLPDEIERAYDEARIVFSNYAYTSTELICRKILMHVAVDKGADEGEKFVIYIDYLQNNNWIAPTMKKWVNKIRENGNESTHKIPSPDDKRAESTLIFTEQLLKLVYEMDYYTSHYTNATADTDTDQSNT